MGGVGAQEESMLVELDEREKLCHSNESRRSGEFCAVLEAAIQGRMVLTSSLLGALDYGDAQE